MAKLFSANMGPGATIRMDVGSGFDQAERVFNKKTIDDLRVAFETGVFRAANILKDEWVLVYTEGEAPGPALHGFTIGQKGHSKPLFDTGELSRSVTVTFFEKGRGRTDFIVGIEGDAALRGRVHESGTILRVTEKMRNFLAVRGLRLKASTRFLTIPPRPVRELALQRATKEMEKVIGQQLRNSSFGNIIF